LKTLERLVLEGCAFAILISLLFFAVGAIAGTSDTLSMPFTQYLVILLFGFVIAIVNSVFKVEKLHIAIRFAIHFITLLVAFLVVFANGAIKLDSVADFFVALVVFAIFYLVIALIALLIKKTLGGLDGAIGKSKAHKNSAKSEKMSKKEAKKYEPRFK